MTGWRKSRECDLECGTCSSQQVLVVGKMSRAAWSSIKSQAYRLGKIRSAHYYRRDSAELELESIRAAHRQELTYFVIAFKVAQLVTLPAKVQHRLGTFVLIALLYLRWQRSMAHDYGIWHAGLPSVWTKITFRAQDDLCTSICGSRRL